MPILVLLFLLLLPLNGWAAIAEVGSGSQRAEGICDGADTCNAVYPGNVTSGNLVVAAGQWFSGGASTAITQLTVTSTCTTGNWTLYGIELTTDTWMWIGYAVATSSAACTVTTDGVSAGDYHAYTVDEFSGQHATPFSVDGAGATGTSTDPQDGLTTTTDNELIIGVTGHGHSSVTTMTPDTGTQINEEEDGTTHAVYNATFRVVTTAGAYVADWTFSASRTWGAYAVSFKEATGGGGGGAETFGFRLRLRQ